MELKDLCCINKKVNSLKKEAFIGKIEILLKKKGITNDEDMAWYFFFLKSALLYLEQCCRFEDFSFESLIMLCKTTKPDEDSECSVYDVLLDIWGGERARLVEDYRFVTAKKIPEKPDVVLKEIFEEIGKQEHLVEIENECRLARVKESEFKSSMVPKYVNSIDIVKDEETGERYFVYPM